ncbi:hypothetical protein FGIG_05743 [Fasciola gigantica]|uniref:MARVEL domain-containing protein n=1 Tax=Fasciola gigantica TaxID=46835 RepID=A0A504Z061_FASGI|nr:hypothetical protein FGIG_05230 [Fasciola gigantica]TPP66189.1 hypothetical protein FGIG_05743 [Fasciola gigantica]
MADSNGTKLSHIVEGTMGGGSPILKNPQKRQWSYFEGYFKTFPAIIRMVEIGLMFVAFIMSCVDKTFLSVGGSWLVVTNVLSLFISIFFLVFHLFLLHRFVLAPWTLIEFTSGVLVCILIFSSGVLSAAYSHIGAIVIAQTVFLFLSLAVYIVDGLVSFKVLLAGRYYD